MMLIVMVLGRFLEWIALFIPSLIDQPGNPATRLRLMAATVQALINWEPRITITRVDVLGGGMDGALTVELTWQRKDGGAPESASIAIPTGAAN